MPTHHATASSGETAQLGSRPSKNSRSNWRMRAMRDEPPTSTSSSTSSLTAPSQLLTIDARTAAKVEQVWGEHVTAEEALGMKLCLHAMRLLEKKETFFPDSAARVLI